MITTSFSLNSTKIVNLELERFFVELFLMLGKIHDFVDVVVDTHGKGHGGGGARLFALLAGG